VNTVVLTGAAGKIGATLRAAWRGRYPLLRLVDERDPAGPGEGEETHVLELADFQATRRAMEGADAVVHLAAIPVEDQFDRLLEANIAATYNVFEASRQAGLRRVVFASTNHVTGFYRRDQRIGPGDPVRPDSLYGVTKVFGEALGRLYADKWELEVVCLRIGSFGDRPRDADALPMWLSPGDAVRLFTHALDATGIPRFLVVYGASKVPGPWWDNPGAAVLGYEPADDVDPELGRALAAEEPSSDFQGGRFARQDHWIEPAPASPYRPK
jgi:uronate dehydrogenase